MRKVVTFEIIAIVIVVYHIKGQVVPSRLRNHACHYNGFFVAFGIAPIVLSIICLPPIVVVFVEHETHLDIVVRIWFVLSAPDRVLNAWLYITDPDPCVEPESITTDAITEPKLVILIE